jgi:hypothetical protein
METEKTNSLNTFIIIGVLILGCFLGLMYEFNPTKAIQILSYLPYGLIIILYLKTISLEKRIESLESVKSTKKTKHDQELDRI